MLSSYAKIYAKQSASMQGALLLKVPARILSTTTEYGYSSLAATCNRNYNFSSSGSRPVQQVTPMMHVHSFSSRANIIAPVTEEGRGLASGLGISRNSNNATINIGDINRIAQGGKNKRTFSALTPDVIDLMRSEFEAVDANNDEKIDSEELKQLLRRHKNVFKESEILEISEMFYVGNAGKAVPFDTLLEAIDNTLTPRESRRKNILGVGTCAAEYYYDVNHHQWKEDELQISLTHVEPKSASDKIAYNAVKLVRSGFDFATGWNHEITVKKILQRTIFLETIAAVPGMTAAIIRHFQSLRRMERDGGLINMFLEEATNERMHLLSFVTLRDPSLAFRASVIGSQFAFGSGFLLAYMISPQFCHRFVGYVEEEACSTYTKIIEAMETAPEGSELAEWKKEPCPKIGIAYWHLGEKGTILDLMYAVRADEAEHRDVNHSVVEMNPGDVNPRFDPNVRLDGALKKYVSDMMLRAAPQ